MLLLRVVKGRGPDVIMIRALRAELRRASENYFQYSSPPAHFSCCAGAIILGLLKATHSSSIVFITMQTISL